LGLTGPVWHGSDEEGYNTFEVQNTAYGFFFSPDPDTAGYYGETRRFYLDVKNMADFDDDMIFGKVAENAIWSDESGRDQETVDGIIKDMVENEESIRFLNMWLDDRVEPSVEEIGSFEEAKSYVKGKSLPEDILEEFPVAKKYFDQYAPLQNIEIQYAREAYGTQNFYLNYQDDFLKAAENMGYDGVIFTDPAGSSGGESVSIAVFNAEQIKLADPITYDDKGVIVPLSKRFNFSSSDIRESLRGVE
jgi:hypothetical protein